MKIAIFIKRTTFHKGFGGMETQNKNLSEGLAKAGNTVIVYSPQLDLEDKEISQNDVRYVFIDGSTRKLFSSLDKNSWYNKSLQYFETEHSEKRFDIVLSQSSAGLSITDNKDKHHVPIITISHGTILGELKTFIQSNGLLSNFPRTIINLQYVLRQYFGAQKRLINNSDHIIAVSSVVKDALRREVILPQEKCTVIFNGVDTVNNSPDSNDTDLKKGVLFLGQIHKNKGIEDLIKMIIDPEFKHVQFCIIGDGPELENIQKTVNASSKKSTVEITGKISYEKVIKKLSSLYGYIFLFPTKRQEGFPMTLVEAMMHGLVIVAYKMGGVVDAVNDNKTGFLVTPGNYPALRQKTLELLKDDRNRGIIASEAVKFAHERFSSAKMVESYLKIINKVLEI